LVVLSWSQSRLLPVAGHVRGDRLQTLNVKQGNGYGLVINSYLRIIWNSDSDRPAARHEHFRMSDVVSGPVRSDEPEWGERTLSDELENVLVRHTLTLLLTRSKGGGRAGKRARLA
jgi:hypothetical protein